MGIFERSVLGLDIGSHGIKAVELKVSPGSLEPGQFQVLQKRIGHHDIRLDRLSERLASAQSLGHPE